MNFIQHKDRCSSVYINNTDGDIPTVTFKTDKMEKCMFHLSLPCEDLDKTTMFYTDILGGRLGRNSENWIDINLYQNQITFTKSGSFKFDFKNYRFGKEILPSFHFGVIVDATLWGKMYAKLFKMDIEVTTETTYLKDKPGEHLSFFVKDPNGYMLEFKSFKNEYEVFRIR